MCERQQNLSNVMHLTSLSCGLDYVARPPHERRVERIIAQDERAVSVWHSNRRDRPAQCYRSGRGGGNAHEFKRGREFSAWLSLIPRQAPGGGRDV